ncbi:MAG: SWIM zinc finger family protein [Phycisphaerales bacterium]|nr:SWIM zinc finger family protein [Phycisphaerales bacterium]
MSWGRSWRPYVSVGERRARAFLEMEKLRKKGWKIQPVKIAGRQIARTFWGRSWCEHLEKFSDFENRLPRGQTYVRNGSVCHLEIKPGKIAAKVSGSDLYDVTITIKALAKPHWKRLRESCAGQVASLLELLQGRLSDHVMSFVTDRDKGLFPKPREISMDCSCPDWADMCKHVAAVMYGVGARFDEKPELLFLLRGVDHNELISRATAKSIVAKTRKTGRRTLDEQSITEVFGIEIEAPVNAVTRAAASTSSKVVTRPRKKRDLVAGEPTGASPSRPRGQVADATTVRNASSRTGRRRKRS